MSPWIKSRWVLATVLLLIGTGSFLVAWLSRAGENSPRSQGMDTSRLVCDNPSVDVGEIGRPEVKHTYTLRNPYARAFRITKVGKTCNCLDPHFDRRVIGPGESAHVDVSVRVNPKNPALITRFRQRLSIHCNDQDDRLELELSGTYVPPLYYETTQINLFAPEMVGGSFGDKFEIFLRGDPSARRRHF